MKKQMHLNKVEKRTNIVSTSHKRGILSFEDALGYLLTLT